MPVQLDRELEDFEAALPGLLRDPAVAGRFVVVAHGQPILASFPSFDDALQAGYDTFGLDRLFLVKQVVEREAPLYFSRNITPCR